MQTTACLPRQWLQMATSVTAISMLGNIPSMKLPYHVCKCAPKQTYNPNLAMSLLADNTTTLMVNLS
jgi:hypothetical protein